MDIFAFPLGESRYDSDRLEITNDLEELLQQIDLLLFTNKGDALCFPQFGCNLEGYLFETNYNASYIEEDINAQISTFINKDGFDVQAKVQFVEWTNNVAMMLDIVINDTKLVSYLI